MVAPRRLIPGLFSFVTVLLLLIACGGGDATPAATATSARVATATPTGPTATVDPRSGPPGTVITISGSGWPAGASVDLIGDLERHQQGAPYQTVTADDNGKFQTSFRIEKTASGDDLATGRYDIFARSGDTQVDMLFLVEVPRPVGGSDNGG